MSDHFDTEDSRTDLTDLYIFPAASGEAPSVLILDFNPEAVADEVSFDPAASYEIKIDTDGDLEADVAFHVLFGGGPARRLSLSRAAASSRDRRYPSRVRSRRAEATLPRHHCRPGDSPTS